MRLVDVALERAHSSTQEDLGEYLTYASERHRTSHFMANVGRRLPGGSPAAGAGCGHCPPGRHGSFGVPSDHDAGDKPLTGSGAPGLRPLRLP